MLNLYLRILDAGQILFGVIKIIASSRFFISVGDFRSGQSNQTLIIGNGPSLRDTLAVDIDFFQNKDLFCVNSFCLSPEFVRLKPVYYVISAPEYWMEVPPTDFHLSMRNSFFEILNKDVSWPMTVFVPVEAKKSRIWKNVFSKNSNIQICYYNNTGVDGPQWFVNWVMKHDIALPRIHNVLAPCIYLALNLNYKDIYLTGADHSWHEEVKIDDENNFIVNHEHFYDSKRADGPMHKLSGEKYYFHDFLRKIYLAFRSYHYLAGYADVLNARIYNVSKKSYIDAFPKTKIEEINNV